MPSARCWGYREEELRGMAFLAITHPEDIEPGLSHFRQMVTGELAHTRIEQRCLHQDGQIVWVLISASLLRNAQDDPLYVITQLQNITERKTSEYQLKMLAAELEQQVAMLDIILSTTPDQFHIYDQQGRFLYGSPPALAAMDRHPEDVLGRTWHEIGIPAEPGWDLDAALRQVFQTGQPVAGTTRFPSARGLRDFEQVLSPAREQKRGQIFSAVLTAHDVTERNRAEEALRESEATNRSILAAIPDLMFRLDRTWKISGCARSDPDLLVVPAEQLVGSTLTKRSRPKWPTSSRSIFMPHWKPVKYRCLNTSWACWPAPATSRPGWSSAARMKCCSSSAT